MNSILGNENEYIGVLKHGKHQMKSVFETWETSNEKCILFISLVLIDVNIYT